MTFKWTDELKAQVIKDYKAQEPTPENSMEIVTQIAEEIGASPNGVRLVLSKADAYVAIKPKASAKAAGGAGAAAKGTRVSKESAHEALKDAIEAAGKEADMEIISKLTGKAAQYFTGLFKA